MKSRRTFIRSTAVASAGLLASKSFAFSIGEKHLQPDELIIGQNGFTYKVDHGWAKINPIEVTDCVFDPFPYTSGDEKSLLEIKAK